MICYLLDKKDLQNVRCVSRKLANVGLEFLTVDGHFVFRKHSLERLQNIAEHPSLNRNLRHITFIVDVLPRYRSTKIWECQAQATCHKTPSKEDTIARDWLQQYDRSSTVPLEKLHPKYRVPGWQHQLKIRAEQEILLLDMKNTIKAIRESLARLTSLEGFLLTTFSAKHDPVMQFLYKVDLQASWYCWNQTCSPESFEIVCTHLFHTLLETRSLSHHQPSLATYHLKSLQISASDFANFNEETSLFRLLWASPTILYSLQSLKLESYSLDRFISVFDYNQTHCTDEKSGPFFRQLLGNSRNLQTLGIKVKVEPALRLQTFVGKTHWPHLRILHLAELQTTWKLFQDFLTLHANTLTLMALNRVQLHHRDDVEYGWIELFKFLKQNLDLENIFLVDRLSERDGYEFHCQADIRFESGSHISVHNAVQWLVCETCSSPMPQSDTGLDDVKTLTWDDILVAYQ